MMALKVKLVLVIYLTFWSTLIAWLTSLPVKEAFLAMGLPFLKLFVGFPATAVFFALPIALHSAAGLFRRNRVLTPRAITIYFLATPAKIFLALLVFVSVTMTIFFIQTFIIGLFVGLIPLLLGTMVHCLGILPLRYFGIESDGSKAPRRDGGRFLSRIVRLVRFNPAP
jgi:hypothetical protein